MTGTAIRIASTGQRLRAFPALKQGEKPHDSKLDSGIAPFVNALRSAGIETTESCESGEGHSYAVPTITFSGVVGEGYRAISVCLNLNLPVMTLARKWDVWKGEMDGPEWVLEFSRKATDEEREQFPSTADES